MAPRKKQSTRKSELPPDEQIIEPIASSSPGRPAFFSWKTGLVLLIIVAGFLIWRNKGMFLAATVNGNMITKKELNNYLMGRFGKQSLDALINEQLIMDGTQKQGVQVNKDEVDSKVKEIEARLAGQTSLKDALAAQGMDENSFRKQLEIQIAIEKLFSKDASVSGQEIDEYLKQNAEMTKQSTDQAKLKEDVASILKQQKMTEKFDTWFEELKKNAAIQSYL